MLDLEHFSFDRIDLIDIDIRGRVENFLLEVVDVVVHECSNFEVGVDDVVDSPVEAHHGALGEVFWVVGEAFVHVVEAVAFPVLDRDEVILSGHQDDFAGLHSVGGIVDDFVVDVAESSCHEGEAVIEGFELRALMVSRAVFDEKFV